MIIGIQHKTRLCCCALGLCAGTKFQEILNGTRRNGAEQSGSATATLIAAGFGAVLLLAL
jgi:hypothetical protein